MSIDPRECYVVLASDGSSTELAGGDAIWSLPAAEGERHGAGWMISEFAFDADWSNWEMHPEGDEFVYLLSGSADLLLEEGTAIRRVELRGRGAVLVPKGVWHTARIHAPSAMLHVTRGAGTQSRLVTPGDGAS